MGTFVKRVRIFDEDGNTIKICKNTKEARADLLLNTHNIVDHLRDRTAIKAPFDKIYFIEYFDAFQVSFVFGANGEIRKKLYPDKFHEVHIYVLQPGFIKWNNTSLIHINGIGYLTDLAEEQAEKWAKSMCDNKFNIKYLGAVKVKAK